MFAVVRIPSCHLHTHFPDSHTHFSNAMFAPDPLLNHSHHQACLCPQVSEGRYLPGKPGTEGLGNKGRKWLIPSRRGIQTQLQRRDSHGGWMGWRLSKVKIRGHGGYAHCVFGISGDSRKLEYWDGDMGKMPRLEIELGASFQEPWMLS